VSEHEHGPPSVDAGGVKRVLWFLYAVLAVFIAIDVVWFGPDWLDNLGQDTHHEEPAHADPTHADPAHADPAHAAPDTEEHWPDAQDSPEGQPPHPVGHMAKTNTDQVSFGGHKHGHFGFEKVPAFHALYGFAGFVFLVLAARVLRLFVMRDEDYYGDDAPLDAEQHTEDGHA
jgi:hypothetical protein